LLPDPLLYLEFVERCRRSLESRDERGRILSPDAKPEAGIVREVGCASMPSESPAACGNMYASEVMRRLRRRGLMRSFSAVRTSGEDDAHVVAIFEAMLLRTVLAQPVVANPMGVDYPAASAYSKAVELTFASPKGPLAFRICAL
jgi:hypothetical protein